jgi:hypothetical protein
VTEWIRCKRPPILPYAYDLPSNIKFHFNLNIRGYRALVYRSKTHPLQWGEQDVPDNTSIQIVVPFFFARNNFSLPEGVYIQYI